MHLNKYSSLSLSPLVVSNHRRMNTWLFSVLCVELPRQETSYELLKNAEREDCIEVQVPSSQMEKYQSVVQRWPSCIFPRLIRRVLLVFSGFWPLWNAGFCFCLNKISFNKDKASIFIHRLDRKLLWICQKPMGSHKKRRFIMFWVCDKYFFPSRPEGINLG